MAVHIYQRGKLSKKADEGLTFEQQMGTMTSARVNEQFPMLSPYLVGFEVLDKNDDGTYGVGTMVYMMGNQAFYIPSFYNNGRLKTGEMIVIRDQQQFIPATEGLISYMKARYDKGSGTIFPKFKNNITKGSPGSVKVKDDDFPIHKNASLEPYTVNILDTAIGMGKHASAQLVDIISADTRMFNDFMGYYGLDKVASFRDSFTNQHTPKKDKIDTWVVNPLDKSASVLSDDERRALNSFGFLIKTAKNDFPNVVSEADVSDQFVSVTSNGVYDILDQRGKLHRAVVIRVADDNRLCGCEISCSPSRNNPNAAPSRYLNAPTHKDSADHVVLIFEEGDKGYYQECDYTPTGVRIGDSTVTFEYLEKAGTPIKNVDSIGYSDLIVGPEGDALRAGSSYVSLGDGSFVSTCTGDSAISVSDIIKVIKTKDSSITVPEGSVVIKNINNKGSEDKKPENMSWEEWDKKKTKEKYDSAIIPVRPQHVNSAIMNYINSKYETIKIFSNGTGFTVSGNNSEPRDMSIKEASFTLTNNYSVDPLDAPHMVLSAYPEDGVSNNSVRWCIEKKAAGGDYSRGASPYDIPNMGYNEVSYDGPQVDTVGSDGVIPAQGASREQIIDQVRKASDSGVKEIFDVSVMKVLVKTSRPESLLGDYYTTILRMMDRLCRMLFLGYTKEDDFKNQYGEDKYEEYMETIRNSMKDLSELFVFVTTRSVIEDTMDTDGADDLTDGNI